MRETVVRTLLLVLLIVAALSAQVPKKFQPGFNFFSKEQNVQLGRENAAQVCTQMPMVQDPFLLDYVNR